MDFFKVSIYIQEFVGLLVKFLVNLTCFHNFSEQNDYFHPKESLFWSKKGLNFLIDMELVENGEEFRVLIFRTKNIKNTSFNHFPNQSDSEASFPTSNGLPHP